MSSGALRARFDASWLRSPAGARPAQARRGRGRGRGDAGWEVGSRVTVRDTQPSAPVHAGARRTTWPRLQPAADRIACAAARRCPSGDHGHGRPGGVAACLCRCVCILGGLRASDWHIARRPRTTRVATVVGATINAVTVCMSPPVGLGVLRPHEGVGRCVWQPRWLAAPACSASTLSPWPDPDQQTYGAHLVSGSAVCCCGCRTKSRLRCLCCQAGFCEAQAARVTCRKREVRLARHLRAWQTCLQACACA